VKRLLDLLFALLLIITLLPIMLVIGLIVVLSSKGPALFKQERVGRLKVNFMILKFRTMKTDSEQAGQLTVGGKDPRVTGIGYILRKFKIDEWPQLWNIMVGEMSFVGPRPEVPKYVSLYTEDQLRVLDARPGLTDLASVVYFSENELLSKADDAEKEYIENIMQEKLRLNLKHIDSQSFGKDIKVIGMTLLRLIRPAAE
jgi:lipopolysaccharide/colanic/teichoic acid biosynthesis glycosyltransferase